MPRQSKARHARRVEARRRIKAAKAASASMLRLTGGPEVTFKAAGGDGKKLATFDTTAYTGGIMHPSGWYGDIVVDLSRTTVEAGQRPSFLGHDPEKIVGHCDSVKIEKNSVTAKGVISGTGPAAKEVTANDANGFKWRTSVGMSIDDVDYYDEDEKVKVNGQTFEGPVTVVSGVIQEISFVPLAGDNNASATIAASFSKEFTKMKFSAWLKAKKFDPATLTADQKSSLMAMFQAEMKAAGKTVKAEDESDDDSEEGADAEGDDDMDDADDPTDTEGAEEEEESAEGEGESDDESEGDEEEEGEEDEEPVDAKASARKSQLRASQGGSGKRKNLTAQLRAEGAAERTRQIRIGKICARYAGVKFINTANGKTRDLQAHAIAKGWTTDETELYALRASRPRVAAAHIRGREQDCTVNVLQASLLLRCNMQLDSKIWAHQLMVPHVPAWLRQGINSDGRQKVMEAAHRYSGLSLMDMAEEAIRLDGKHVPRGDKNAVLKAAFSGGSLTNIFTTNVNAVVLATYLEAPDTTTGWTREGEVANFLPAPRMRLTKAGTLDKLARGKEANHASRSDTAEELRVARYAKQYVIDEQDMIDDYFGALLDTPKEMGLAAQRLRPDLVYSILKANAALADGVALFHSTHANTDTSAGLAADKLKACITAMRIQRENGTNLNLEPTHLIVPATLEFTGAELINSSQIIIAGTAGAVTERGNINTIAAKNLTLVSESRLDNGVIDPVDGTSHAGDLNDWFLAAAAGHTIEVAYLRGSGKVPRVRPFMLDKGKYGVGWDVSHDIGAKALDFRAIQRRQG